MSFLDLCVEDSLPIWQRCLETDFLRRLADGTLEEACFQGYLVDDSLYLREYARVFAWGMLHAVDMEEMRAFYSILAFVNEAEDSTRRYYLHLYGLDDGAIQALPLRPENQAYVDTMLSAAREGPGAAECMMACMPCMLSYFWLFGQMEERFPGVARTPYGRFVADYTGERYTNLCRSWSAFTDRVCADLDAARRERCLAIFRACSQHEYHFWRMSERPRTDLALARVSQEEVRR
ncbi:MAG: TENA/THI-4 family protein [Oscillibacter sp.]|nr:TENA/THI-4 family protein [Oscillibacter sp.]